MTNGQSVDQRSWWRKTFGRSLLKAVIGDFFDSKRNTASIIAIMLVGTFCYVIVVEEKFEYMSVVANLAFAVAGFYFGAKSEQSTEADEGD